MTSVGERAVGGRFTDEGLLRRASLRVAAIIRGMWEEAGSSDTRLLDSLLIPDRLVVVGQSKQYAERPGGMKGRREHVVPRLVIIEECHAMIARGETDQAVADFIRLHNKIVLVTEEEARRMDDVRQAGLRQKMPEQWVFGSDLFRRLELAGIEWSPVESGPGSAVEGTGCRYPLS